MNHNMTYNKTWQCILIVTLLSIFTLPVQAAVPDNVDYQGYLTDSGGSPINGAVSITFSLYNIDTGGISLWTDTQSVTLTNGLFTVKLGRVGNPFPLGLFDAPLWLGINVASDGEMSPRIELSSAGFAHKADDALTLEGQSASSLDQSAHVTDTSNPHNVTATQTGAVSSASFTLHTGDAGAHHIRYSNVDAINAMGAMGDTNPLHHDKYTDGNAVAAMGVLDNANPLNHDRRTGGQVFNAVLSRDGAGTTLDADLVDGLEASEIIDAAADEVRTPISSLPFTISTSGSYYLTGDLTSSGGVSGITVNADHVTIDLMGFSLISDGSTTTYGILLTGRTNVTILNGTVRGFGLAGIFQSSTAGRYATVMDVKVLGNGTWGTATQHAGIYLLSSNSHVERCTAGDNGGDGIVVFTSSKVINNTAYGNSGGYGISGGYGSTLSGNTVYSNTSNTAIYGGFGATLNGNTAYSNTGTYAIFGSNGAILSGNIAQGNTVSYAIYGGLGATLNGNTVYNNTRWGIVGGGANIIRNNMIYSNNTSVTANEGGLRVGHNSRVMSNTLDSNAVNNIYVTFDDNVLIENHVTDSTTGINFVFAGNYYRNNTASGNTTNYTGSVPTGSGDGGGNASF